MNSAITGIGLIAGLLNGLIAVGGGIVIVPGLIRYRNASPQVAVGTSLAAIIVLSSVAFFAHFLFAGHAIDTSALIAAVLGGTAGTQFGALILARLDTRRMLKLFALFILLLSLRLLSQGFGIGVSSEELNGIPPFWAYPVVGFVSGVLSGVFGVGGGAMVLLGLAVFFGLSIDQGITLALVVNVTNALAGCIRHASAGRILWSDVARLIPAALVGIAIGTTLALHLPANSLRIVFGGFFLFMSIRIGRQALKVS